MSAPPIPAVSLDSAASLACGPASRPGWTRARVRWRAGGCAYCAAVSAYAAGPAATASAAAARPSARPVQRAAVSAITTPVFEATSAKLISQVPPTAASASTTGCCHWLAPYTAQGPPMPCHDRIQSISTQLLGSTSSAAVACSTVGPGATKRLRARAYRLFGRKTAAACRPPARVAISGLAVVCDAAPGPAVGADPRTGKPAPGTVGAGIGTARGC